MIFCSPDPTTNSETTNNPEFSLFCLTNQIDFDGKNRYVPNKQTRIETLVRTYNLFKKYSENSD